MISQTLRDARRYEDAMAQNITPLERPEIGRASCRERV